MDKILIMGAGRTLFKQGDKGGDLYFIKSGTVELVVRNEETGAEAVVANVGPRSVIGTMSFLEGDPRSATAVAKTEVKYVLISQTQRDRLLQTVPSWFQVLVKDLSHSMRRLNDNFAKMTADKKAMQKKFEAKASQKEALDKQLESDTQKMRKQEAEWKKQEADFRKEIKNLKSELATAQAAADNGKK